MFGRFSVAGAFFLAVTVGNLIQKVYPNEYTVWFRNPIITMAFYAIAVVIAFLPWTKGKFGILVIALAIGIAGVLTYAFSLLFGGSV